MTSGGYLELSSPVQFEPVGQVTTVFYDDKNQQVFSVRSGGATGVTVKSPHSRTTTTYRIQDKGPIISIKLSPNKAVLSIQRSKNSVEFLNVTPGGEVDVDGEYSQVCKARSAAILGYLWTSNTEIVYITDHGVEIYNIVQEKKIIKYLRSNAVNIKWFVSCPRTFTIVTSQTEATQTLQLWSVKTGALYKLPVITTNNSVKDKDVNIVQVYGKTFVSVMAHEDSGNVDKIHLYHVHNDQVSLAHILSVSSSGSGLGLHCVDNLLLVHCLAEANTRVYDVGLQGQPHTDCCSVRVHSPALPPCSLPDSKAGNQAPKAYSPSWVVFLPNILVDARYGCMWTTQLRLSKATCVDKTHLAKLLLNREGGKAPLLNLLERLVLDAGTPLSTVQTLFNLMNESYQQHQHSQTEPYMTYRSTSYLSSSFPLPPSLSPGLAPIPQHLTVSPVVVLDQSDVFTNVFSPCETSASGRLQILRLRSVLIEFLLSLLHHDLQPRQFLYELLINLCVQMGDFYQLHQLLQYHVIGDSKPVACLLLSLETVYPGARQMALDMMTRLGSATEEIVEILLANSQLIPALNLVKNHGLTDTVSARKFLEAAEDSNDSLVFFNVYKFFEERNRRLRGCSAFGPGDRCDKYVRKFNEVFGENDAGGH